MLQGGSGKQGGSNRKVGNGLVALSCAAVLAVYSAGFVRTRAAADRLEAQSEERRPGTSESARVDPQAELRPVVAEVPVPAVENRRPEAPAPDIVKSSPASVPDLKTAPVAPVAAVAPVEAPAAPVTVASVAAPISAPVVAAPVVTTPAVTPAAAPQAVAAPVITAPAVAPPTTSVIALAPPPAAPAPAPAAATAKWKDGTYYGWGTSRHGDIEAEVIIAGGRIESATISQCRTRYPCSVIEKLPPEVALRQSPEVDYVSRATQSANAFYYAVVEALGKAK